MEWLFVLAALSPVPLQDAGAPLLVEAGASALPDGVRTTCGGAEKDFILEVNGGGLVVEDFDADGRLDLVVIDGSTIERVRAGEPGLPPRLFLNRGEGRFAPADGAWTMSGGRWGMGGAAGDVDGDGFVDLFVTQWGPDRLFLNRGGKGFEEVPAERSGLVGSRWGTSATFLDYDGDGKLDLAVANYIDFDPAVVPARGSGCTWKGHEVMCGPEGLVPVHDQLWRGNGDGTFSDASVVAGYRPEAAGFALGVIALDYDRDGDTDLYVANDSTPNFLWENRGDGTFLEVGFRRGVSHDANGKEQAGMGLAAGDVDGDGRDDLFVTNFSGENNALYASKGRGFRERSSQVGLFGASLRSLGWGTGLVDLDLDGDLDLFVLNGHVYPQASLPGTDTSYEQQDQWFEQRNSTAKGIDAVEFVEHPLSDGAPSVTRAGVAADLDGDGDLDIAALDLGGPVRVLRNLTRERGGQSPPHWLSVRLRQGTGNRDAIGARVELVFEDATRSAREIRSGVGFQASGPLLAHFGLGSRTRIERIDVFWPAGGERETFTAPEGVDRTLLLVRGAGESAKPSTPSKPANPEEAR